MSGLSRTPGKRVWANPHRGFESRPLRQNMSPSDQFTWAFLLLAIERPRRRMQVCHTLRARDMARTSAQVPRSMV